MTTTICDICGKALAANYRMEDTLKGTAQLVSATVANPVAVREFDFSITVTTFRFNMTNFHVCNACIVEAVSRSMDKEKE